MRIFAASLAMVSLLCAGAAIADPGIPMTKMKPIAPSKMHGMMPPPPPRMLGPDKGEAVQINFIAPVTDDTMADLVKTVQDASTLGYKRAVIFISSGGGSVLSARFALSAMKATDIQIDTVVAADVGSAAVALYCAGENRYFAPTGILFLHQMRSIADLSLKTVEAGMQKTEIYRAWYRKTLETCAGVEELPDEFDFSVRDQVLDAADATRLGMANAEFEELKSVDYGMTAFNILDRQFPVFMPPRGHN